MTEYRFKTIYVDDDRHPCFWAILCCSADHWDRLLALTKKVRDDYDTVEVSTGNGNSLTVDMGDLVDLLEDAALVDEGHFMDLKELLGPDATLNDDETCLWFGAGSDLADVDFWEGML